VAVTPLRVVVVADVSPVVVLGGSERVVWEQSRRLAARGHRVHVVSRSPDGSASLPASREGVGFRHFTVGRRSAADFIHGSILGARRAVLEEVGEHGADVLHFNQPLSAFGALTSRALRRLPSLYTFHSPAPLEYLGRRGTTGLHRRGAAGGAGAALLRALERWSLARVTRIHVLSDYSAGLLRTLYGIGGDRVVKIPGGVDPRRFRPADAPRDAVRVELGWPTNRPVLFTLRNLEPRMGLDELIRAVARLRRQIPDALLMVGGDGSLRAELQGLVTTLGLADHVRLLGYVEEERLARCYQAADLFVLPTQALEGFGLVTVESLACGTPVLGTPVGAIPEILVPLEKSLVLSGTTATAMAEDLARFLERGAHDPAAREALRHACRLYAETQYAWEGAVDRLEETLHALAGARGAAAGCRVCGGPLRAGFAFRTRTYVVCADCGTAVRDVLPARTRVRHLYDVEYPLAFDHAKAAAPRRRLFRSIAASLTRRAGRPGRLIDVGCSGGHLLAEAARMGWHGVGSDLSHQACAVTRAGVRCPAVQSDGAALPVRDGTVDAVALLGIVDLTTDPLATVREAHRVLASGGLLVIRVTNAGFHRPLARALDAARWLGRVAPLQPVFHVFAFDAHGLRTLAERAGFEVVEIRNSRPAAELDEAGGGGRRATTLLRVLAAAVASAIATVSARRWLIGPSIELYARRPGSLSERFEERHGSAGAHGSAR
jgi:glycosyltransferase involved in cell wall biosynthesis/SAM-dependent methyltransferase